MMRNSIAKTGNKGWENHEDDPMEQMRRSLLAKEDIIQGLRRQIKEEVKEKYSLYNRIIELNTQIEKLKSE